MLEGTAECSDEVLGGPIHIFRISVLGSMLDVVERRPEEHRGWGAVFPMPTLGSDMLATITAGLDLCGPAIVTSTASSMQSPLVKSA